MARSVPALVTPEVLRWAREAAGYTTAEAAREIHAYTWEVEAAERGDLDLTMRQAEGLAQLYDRPLAILFLPAPPEEESQEALFRRLPGAPELPWSPPMRKLARRIRDRQDAASELFELLEEPVPWANTASSFNVGTDHLKLAERTRRLLGISVDEQRSWNDPSGYTPLREWVDAIEALGVLVMQDGSMGLDQMRGFASLHPAVPAIVLNTKDDPRSRAFTAIHELGHVLKPEAPETWCNDFAGSVLMPLEPLREDFERRAERHGQPHRAVVHVARAFGVTPAAAAVRLARTRLLNRDDAQSVMAFLQSQKPAQRKPGGDHYRNKVTWLGPAFVRLVLDAADGQALTLSNAAGLLEDKVDHFPGLRQRLDERAAFV